MAIKHLQFVVALMLICIIFALYAILSGNPLREYAFENSFEDASEDAFDESVEEIFTLYVQGETLGFTTKFLEGYNATITLYSNRLLLVDNSTYITISNGYGLDYSADPLFSKQVQLTPLEYAHVKKMIWRVKGVANRITFKESVNGTSPNYALRIGADIYFADGNHYPEDVILAVIHYFWFRIDDSMLRYSDNPQNPRSFSQLLKLPGSADDNCSS